MGTLRDGCCKGEVNIFFNELATTDRNIRLSSMVNEKVKYNDKICGSTIASPNILRFPWASGESPRTTVLRGLTDLLLPTGVSVYSRCLVKVKGQTLRIYHFFSAFLFSMMWG
jgi:hypothetical protein